jgi:glycosyltransferase involved in cell wall biosynthesis
VHSLNLGGAERLASQLATTLSDEFDIAVACLDEAGLWAGEVRAAGVPVYELYRQRGIDLVVPARLAGIARARGVGLMHAHQYSPFFYAALARVLSPTTRLLFHEHGRHYPEVSSPKRIAVNRYALGHLASRVVAVSADVRERLITFEGMPRGLIEVVYNGTKAPPPASAPERQAIREKLGLAPGDVVAGTVGRLDPVKNVPLAVRALAALGPEHPELKLLVVGDGPARREIEAEAAARAVTSSVVMTGFRDDAPELVRAMDMFLLPSKTEGTSLALIGAMAAGIPAIATAVGGNPEVVEDGVTGLLVAPESEPGLIAAMRALIEAPERARSMGDAGRDAYLARFTFDGMVDRFRAIYREELR